MALTLSVIIKYHFRKKLLKFGRNIGVIFTKKIKNAHTLFAVFVPIYKKQAVMVCGDFVRRVCQIRLLIFLQQQFMTKIKKMQRRMRNQLVCKNAKLKVLL